MIGEGNQIVTRKLAVKGITFGVNSGDCFSLLGTNGAGKTTTFKMLSGEIQPSSGLCMVKGMNVVTDMKKIRHLIGNLVLYQQEYYKKKLLYLKIYFLTF